MSGPTATDRTTTTDRRPIALISSLVLGLALLPVAGGAQGASPGSLAARSAPLTRAATGRAPSRAYPALPLSFEPNRGQTDRRVRYLARGHGYTLFLTDSGAVLSFTRSGAPTCTPGSALSYAGRTSALTNAGRAAQTATHRDLSRSGACHDLLRSGHGVGPRQSGSEGVLRLTFPGAAAHSTLIPQSQLPGAVSYLHGRDPRHWQTGLPTYARVAYRDVYPGTDLIYYGHAGQLEYDFVLAPGADPYNLRLRLDSGASGTGAALRLDRSGDLLIAVPGGTLRQRAPVVYQGAGAFRRLVAARYALLDAHTVGVRLGAYDHRAPLVVDPALSYSTYLGGNGDDYGYGIAVDRSGSAYVVGYTNSANFPLANAARGSFGGGADDAFVAKLNPAGNGLVYSTYLGGSDDDFGLAIAVDSAGSAYVTGSTSSGDFPTANALQGSLNGLGGNAFVAKLNPAGNGLVYSTYLGGGIFDVGQGIAVDTSGNAYVTGVTDSSNFPTTGGAFQRTYQGTVGTAFVSKINAAGNGLAYSTYLGGSDSTGNGIAVDSAGAAYVTGAANSANFPTAAPLQGVSGGAGDTFVSKLAPDGSALTYSTYLGGSGGDTGYGIAVDSSGDAIVAGQTNSPNFPTTNAAQNALGGADDAFVAALGPAGNGFVYSTYLGGSGSDIARAVAVDAGGNTYVTGQTTSTNFPTVAPFQGSFNGGAYDAFVAKLGNNPIPPAPPSAAAPSTPAPPASTPIPATATTTATPIPTITPTATVTTAPTITPTVPLTVPARVGTPPSLAPCSSASTLPLTLSAGSHGVVSSGGLLTFTARTRPATHVAATLQVTGQRAFYVGTGKKRRRILRTVLIYRTTTGGASDKKGLFTGRLRVTYKPAYPVRARLNVTVYQSCGRASGALTVTIQQRPPALTVSGDYAVRTGRVLTVFLHTVRGAHVTATLQVTAKRTSYTGSGKKRHRVTRTVVLYHTAVRGMVDRHGTYTARLRVTYKVKKATGASVITTATLYGVTATRARGVAILP